MSEELQNGGDPSEVSTNAQTEQPAENQNNGADLATASDGQHEPNAQVDDGATTESVKPEGFINQDAVNHAIGKQTFKTKQAQRQVLELQGRLDTIERDKQEKLAKSFANAPVIPTYPVDQFADDFEAQLSKFNQDMGDYQGQVQEKANFDANQRQLGQQQQYQQQQTAIAQQAEQHKAITGHSARATALNINPVEMQAAQQAVVSYGIPDDCLMHIVNSEDSPLLFKHLAANPQDGYALANMSAQSQGVFLGGIASKAKELKPKTVTATKPIEQIKGGGAKPVDNKYPNSTGASFS